MTARLAPAPGSFIRLDRHLYRVRTVDRHRGLELEDVAPTVAAPRRIAYTAGRLLGLVLVVAMLVAAVPDPAARAVLILVFLQPLTLLRDVAIRVRRLRA